MGREDSLSHLASSKEAEERAVLTTLERAMANDFDRVYMSMDRKEVLQALKGDQDQSINPIISDIKAFTTLFLCVEFDYIPRALNVQAHMLAKFCFSTRQDVTWERASLILWVGV